MRDQNPTAEITIRYFAWVREKTGRSEERLHLPDNVITIHDLMLWQQTRGEEFASAFARPDLIRSSIDRIHVKAETKIGGGREIGFFPPVTGG